MNNDIIKVRVTTAESDNQPRMVKVMVGKDSTEMIPPDNEKAIYPNYTEFPIYKALVGISENAGIMIEYSDKKELADDGNIIGGSSPDEYTYKVFMAKNHDYGTFEYATFVLAHEIAHTLTKDLYSEAAHHFYSDKIHVRHFF